MSDEPKVTYGEAADIPAVYFTIPAQPKPVTADEWITIVRDTLSEEESE